MSEAGRWPNIMFGDAVAQSKESVDPTTSGIGRYVAGEHMETDRLAISRWGTVGDGYLGPAFHRRFRAGQVLYGSRRTYLRKVAMAEFDGICANTTFVCESADGRLSRRLLPFVMQTEAFHAHSVSRSKGSVNPYINWKDLGSYEFPLPPLDTQERLADLLWALEATALSYERGIAAADNAALAGAHHVMQGESLVVLGQCVTTIEAGRSPSGTNQPATNGALGVLKVSAVGDGIFHPNENKTVIRPDDFVAGAAVREGDILLTRANTSALVGRVCRVPQSYPMLMLSDKTLRLVPAPNVLPDYLVLALRLPSARRQMRVMATGTGGAMKNISQAKLAQLRVPCPGMSKQQQAVDIHAAALTGGAELSNRRREALALKKSLLSSLLVAADV